MRLAGIGELLWDIYPQAKFLGGATFNCVHHSRQLGHEGIIISRVGADPAGQEILDILAGNCISTDYIQIDSQHPTGFVKISLDNHAEPTFTCSDSAPCDYLEWDETFGTLAPTVDAVVFGTFAQRTTQSARITRDFLSLCSKALKVFDVNFRVWDAHTKSCVIDSLPFTDVLKMNENELVKMREIVPGLPEETVACLRTLTERGNLRFCCLTLGRWGCLISDDTETVYCPGIAADPLDTTGGGDAFIAAFILNYLEYGDIARAGHFANCTAYYTIMHYGATPRYNLETVGEIERKDNKYTFREDLRTFHPG